MAFESLPLSRVRKASKLLRSKGLKLPKRGYCVTAGYVKEYGSSTRVEVCRDNRGYYVLPASRGAQGLFGSHKPTIYEALREKLRREPTNPELKAEVSRIKNEGYVQAATQGKLRHQRRRR